VVLLKKITLVLITSLIISLPIIISDNGVDSNQLVRMSMTEVAEQGISQDQIVKRIGQDFLIQK